MKGRWLAKIRRCQRKAGKGRRKQVCHAKGRPVALGRKVVQTGYYTHALARAGVGRRGSAG